MAIVKDPHYWRGDKKLMVCKLRQITEWTLDHDFDFVLEDLRRDRIPWVIKRQRVDHKSHDERKQFFQYALFRKKSFSG